MAKKYENLEKSIKKLLFDNNMRPADLARETNVPTTTIHRIVTGKSTRPYPSTLDTIAKYFGKTVEELKNLGNENLLSNSIIKNVPLLVWENLDTKVASQTLPVHNISDDGFALTMNDSSMEPVFLRGSILIFEPNYKNLNDRSYVLVKFKDTETIIFRQLLIVNDEQYIQALNPEIKEISLKKLTKSDIILGKLIESRTLQAL